jgi:methanogenic corrinoid protein MtbC1
MSLPPLSIGAVSRATGIPAETLRTWEARYGFPVPERRPSGHRVYPASVVPRLRKVAEALARGHRAAQVVPANERSLTTLLGEQVQVALSPRLPESASVSDLIGAVRRYDASTLTTQLLADWGRLGVLAFLEQRVGPLLESIGSGWADGTLEIRHEHFVSEQLGALLSTLAAPLDARATGPACALGTLPGEQHGLGLQMAALVVAASGLRVRLAGTDLPVSELAAFARDVHARVVALSVSAAGASTAARHLRALRKQLPRQLTVIAGGAGAPSGLAGIEHVTSFDALDIRLRRIANP